MSGFPKLIPAFTIHVVIDPPSAIGPVAHGNNLLHVVIKPNAGSITSVDNYPIRLDAEFAHGSDFIRMDPDGKHVRLEVHSAIRDKQTNGLLRFNYTGIINTDVSAGSAAGKIFTGSPEAKTTDFGEAFIHATFETGVPELAAIQHKLFVGGGRFILEEGKPTVVEYKLSEVVN
ncbi:hypothetical protein B0H66DRAFT_596471 [Apodospora peruviana]|uniref:Uncharacterized protein n=1 Tax=Apodospora peruviana TaxID=516989 RepID=A0AAE0IPV9_9PEZI|nr:hypothetical protein B0H66DRAFT_596471 [Apodospora peruviana]